MVEEAAHVTSKLPRAPALAIRCRRAVLKVMNDTTEEGCRNTLGSDIVLTPN